LRQALHFCEVVRWDMLTKSDKESVLANCKVSIARRKFAKPLAYGDLPLFEGQT
jgi:predicted Fe-S protein YdhL (DUF1289 family)